MLSISFLIKTLPSFLWKPGNFNVFLHYPLLALALPGFFVLYRKRRIVFWFLSISTILYFVTICCYSGWSGGWCYGPRHLLFILMSGSIASVCLFEKILLLSRNTKWTTLAICCVISVYSAFWNFQLNTIQCFAYYQLSSIFNQVKIPDISRYFTEYYTRGRIYREIRLHAEGKKEFPPLQKIRYLPNAQRAYTQLDQMVKYFGLPNYYFSKYSQ